MNTVQHLLDIACRTSTPEADNLRLVMEGPHPASIQYDALSAFVTSQVNEHHLDEVTAKEHLIDCRLYLNLPALTSTPYKPAAPSSDGDDGFTTDDGMNPEEFDQEVIQDEDALDLDRIVVVGSE